MCGVQNSQSQRPKTLELTAAQKLPVELYGFTCSHLCSPFSLFSFSSTGLWRPKASYMRCSFSSNDAYVFCILFVHREPLSLSAHPYTAFSSHACINPFCFDVFSLPLRRPFSTSCRLSVCPGAWRTLPTSCAHLRRHCMTRHNKPLVSVLSFSLRIQTQFPADSYQYS